MKDKERLLILLASRFLATQLEQIKLWKADDVNIDKLEDCCLSIASSVLHKGVRLLTEFNEAEADDKEFELPEE